MKNEKIEAEIKELNIFYPDIWCSIDHLRNIGYRVSCIFELGYTFFNFEEAKKRAIEHDDWENFHLNCEYLQQLGELVHRFIIYRMKEFNSEYERDW